jgi:hypothetical protein
MNDERWIEAVREELRPEPMSPAHAAAFRRALGERIERPRAPRFALPALASAAVASLALWLAWPAATPVTPVTQSNIRVASAEIDAYVDPDAIANEVADRAEYLPADYQGLALLLEDDAADR